MWYNCKHKPWRLNTCCDMTRVVMMCCTLWLKLWWCDTRYDTSYDDAIYAVTQTVMRCYSRWRDRQTWVVMMCYAVTVTDFVSQIVTHSSRWCDSWCIMPCYDEKLMVLQWWWLPLYGIISGYSFIIIFKNCFVSDDQFCLRQSFFYPTFRIFLIDDRHYFPQLTE